MGTIVSKEIGRKNFADSVSHPLASENDKDGVDMILKLPKKFLLKIIKTSGTC